MPFGKVAVLWLHLDQTRLSCLSRSKNLWTKIDSNLCPPMYTYGTDYTYIYKKMCFHSIHIIFYLPISIDPFLFSDAVGEGDVALVFDGCGWRSGCCNSCVANVWKGEGCWQGIPAEVNLGCGFHNCNPGIHGSVWLGIFDETNM